MDKIEVDLDMNRITGMIIGEETFRRNNRAGYRANYRNENYSRERGRSRFKERSNSSNFRRNDRSSSNSRSRSGLRASTNTDRIRHNKCRVYDHFTKDCPTTAREKGKTEQIQQMFNLDEEQTALKTMATDTYYSLSRINS